MEPRKDEVARLREALAPHPRGVRVVGVSGPGGVGKSHLLRTVVDAMEAEGASWLKLTADGANEQARGELFAVVEGQLARRTPVASGRAARPRQGERAVDFPELRRVAAMHRALVEAVAAELDTGAAPAEVKGAALELLRMGRRLNRVVPKSKQLFDTGTTEDATVGPTVDEAWRAVTNLRALRTSAWIPSQVRGFFGAGSRERLRTDLYNLTAEALIADLATAIDEGVPVLHRGASGGTIAATRVLIVIDDFEALAPVLEELLVGALVPRLADAPFCSTVVILGRDMLEAMHPAWSQHCRQFLAEPIALAPFDRDEAMAMLEEANVPEERRAWMFEATQGFPFLLSLLAEEARDGADSALFLRRFHDRTTRWLNDRQREWLSRIVYLDAVNIDALTRMFPGEDVEAIQDWFEREASIRDPAAAVFRVRPIIREKVLRYLELRSPSRHREMTERAAS